MHVFPFLNKPFRLANHGIIVALVFHQVFPVDAVFVKFLFGIAVFRAHPMTSSSFLKYVVQIDAFSLRCYRKDAGSWQISGTNFPLHRENYQAQPLPNASLFLDIIFLCVLHPAKNVSNLFRFLHREKMRANANTPIMVMVLMMMARAMTVEL